LPLLLQGQVVRPVSVARFNLFKLATQCGLKFVELLHTQSGTFKVWINGTEREPSETGRHVELQRSK